MAEQRAPIAGLSNTTVFHGGLNLQQDLAPIDTTLPVPPELMGIVFLHLVSSVLSSELYATLNVDTVGSDVHCWTRITLVCHRWRSISLGTPSLWRRIVNSAHTLHLMCSRAGNLPLDRYIMVLEWPDATPHTSRRHRIVLSSRKYWICSHAYRPSTSSNLARFSQNPPLYMPLYFKTYALWISKIVNVRRAPLLPPGTYPPCVSSPYAQ